MRAQILGRYLSEVLRRIDLDRLVFGNSPYKDILFFELLPLVFFKKAISKGGVKNDT